MIDAVGEQALRLVGEGNKAECFLHPGLGLVVKPEKAVFGTVDEAFEHAAGQRSQYEFLSGSNIGPYVADSMLVVGQRDDGFRVASVQRYREGTTIAEALSKAREEDMDITPIVDFYTECILLRRDTGIMPDLTRPGFLDWFRPNRTPNVVVEKKDETLHPTLIDTGLLSGGNFITDAHQQLLAYSVGEALTRMMLFHADRILDPQASLLARQAIRYAT